jgi:hypothetical protein
MSAIFGMQKRITYAFKLLGLSLLTLGSTTAFSAEQVARGTIQAILEEEGGRTVISGQNFTMVPGVTQVILNGEVIDSAYLDQGIVVRYTVNELGVLLRIEIIGPADFIRNFYNH